MKKLVFVFAMVLVSQAALADRECGAGYRYNGIDDRCEYSEVEAKLDAELKKQEAEKAAQLSPSVDVSDCQNKDSSYDIQICFADALKQLDKQLESAHNDAVKAFTGFEISFGDIFKQIKKDSSDALKTFRTYRKAACMLDSAMFTGGSARGGALLSCEVTMTEKRILEVKKLAKEFRTER